jgi:hypothetical protein
MCNINKHSSDTKALIYLFMKKVLSKKIVLKEIIISHKNSKGHDFNILENESAYVSINPIFVAMFFCSSELYKTRAKV